MSDAKRHTRFIEEPSVEVGSSRPATPNVAVSPRKLQRPGRDRPDVEERPAKRGGGRFPISVAVDRPERQLVPVLIGSPWKHYDTRYRIKFGYSFGVVTARGSHHTAMIRTITGRKREEQIQHLRQLCHPNIVAVLEVYTGPDEDYFLISEFMPTSLLHICRSPLYPSEAQLSSILQQVLSGVDFLLGNNLVHEELSCATLLINLEGEVKICDVERCCRGGDVAKLVDSFGRLIMKLMDKEKMEADVPGLTHPDHWSHEAIDMFTTAHSEPTVKELLAHVFLQKQEQRELKWLVHSVLITAAHSRE